MNRRTLASTEFWVTVFAAIGTFIAGISEVLPPTWAAVAATVVAASYALSRGIAKHGGSLKRGPKTTEFWVSVATVVGLVAATIPGGVSAKVGIIAAAVVSAVYALSRGEAKKTSYDEMDIVALSGSADFDTVKWSDAVPEERKP